MARKKLEVKRHLGRSIDNLLPVTRRVQFGKKCQSTNENSLKREMKLFDF
jgi:hypothetical protein